MEKLGILRGGWRYESTRARAFPLVGSVCGKEFFRVCACTHGANQPVGLTACRISGQWELSAKRIGSDRMRSDILP